MFTQNPSIGGSIEGKFKIPSTFKFIFWLTLLICGVCSCIEKKVSVERGSQEEAVTISIDIKAPEGGEPKGNIEGFEKLKKVISENLPNLERQFKKGSNVLVSNNAIN